LKESKGTVSRAANNMAFICCTRHASRTRAALPAARK